MEINCNIRILRYCVLAELFFSMFSGIFVSFGLPTQITYMLDLINIIASILLILNIRYTKYKNFQTISVIVILWIGYMILETFFKDFSMIRVIWAIRNWCRGLAFFFCTLVAFECYDIKKIINVLKWIYLINFVIVLFEFWALKINGDYLGGIFGNQVGSNGYTNIFMCFMLCIVVAEALTYVQMSWVQWFYIFSTMIIASMSELKIFYYEFVIIVFAEIVFYSIVKATYIKRVVKIVCFSVFTIIISAFLLNWVNPRSLKIFGNISNYEHYEETCRNVYGISRLHFISEIRAMFFQGSNVKLLTGIGFGNAEYSSFSFLTSDFWYQYGSTHYTWFSHQFLLIEGGVIGLVLFCLIFVVIALLAAKNVLPKGNKNYYCYPCIIFSIIVCSTIAYNNAIRTEISYFIYFGLGILLKYSMDELDDDIYDITYLRRPIKGE